MPNTEPIVSILILIRYCVGLPDRILSPALFFSNANVRHCNAAPRSLNRTCDCEATQFTAMASRADGKSLRAGFSKCMRRREGLPASLGQGKVALAENETAITPYGRPVGLICGELRASYTALPDASAARPT